jgi:peroxiredoxin
MNQALKVMLLMILTSAILITGCSAEAPEIGKPAPSFQLADIEGQSISLSDFQGKPVLINFWAIYCVPCRSELSYIQEVYDEWSEQGLMVLAINIHEDPPSVDRYIQDYNLSFPVLFDLEGKVAERYNIQYIPTTYFIDAEGIIRDIKIGAFRSGAEIEDLLNKIFP